MTDTTVAFRELCAGLEMPDAGLRRWFTLLWKAAHAHGGPRHYHELLELYEDCLGRLGGPLDRSTLAVRGSRFSRDEPPRRVSLRMNSLFMVTQLAIDELDHPWVNRHRDALVLGALREDVIYVPLLGFIWEHLSFSHFYRKRLPGGFIPLLWPGPRLKADLFYRRAQRHLRAGEPAAACVQLGRALHLVADMTCPVHAQGVVHDTDRFEWYLEANKNTLMKLPLPDLPTVTRAADCVEGVARATQPFPADRTNHHTGRLLKRLGLRKAVRREDVVEQAKVLVPVAAAHAAALLQLFLEQERPAP